MSNSRLRDTSNHPFDSHIDSSNQPTPRLDYRRSRRRTSWPGRTTSTTSRPRYGHVGRCIHWSIHHIIRARCRSPLLDRAHDSPPTQTEIDLGQVQARAHGLLHRQAPDEGDGRPRGRILPRQRRPGPRLHLQGPFILGRGLLTLAWPSIDVQSLRETTSSLNQPTLPFINPPQQNSTYTGRGEADGGAGRGVRGEPLRVQGRGGPGAAGQGQGLRGGGARGGQGGWVGVCGVVCVACVM